MPKSVFVTRGEYAGRYMRLEDDVADAALSDGWARESETEPVLKEGEEPEEQDSEDPDSLIAWEDSLNQDPTAEGEEASEKPARRKRKTSSSE